MTSRRRVIGLRLLVAVIGLVVMIATLIELKDRWVVAREQRAIANLVKAGAIVQLLDEKNGIRYYMIRLDCWDRSKSNDELLRYVSDIGNVRCLSLAPLPLHESGVKYLSHLGKLEILHVYVGNHSVSREQYATLKREMKLLNPNMDIQTTDLYDKAVD